MSPAKGALVITGGSRGIGAACARLAARDGWPVLITYRSRAAEAEAVLAAIRAAGGKAEAIRADAASEEDTKAAFDAAEALAGRVEGLVNNAGILDLATSFETISTERWRRIIETNTTGAFLAAREAVLRMKGAGGGSIVNMSSMAAPLGAGGEFIDYAASKGAVESMTLGMAKELGPHGIRVNAVRPGLIATDIHADGGDADRAERLLGSVPLGRVGTADEVAEATCWLLSDKASYVTGAILPVSGGR